MFKKLNKNLVFIGGTCIVGVLLAVIFEFVVNKIFPQPTFFFSFSRLTAVAIAIISTICLFRYRKFFCQNLHKAFLLLALSFGVAFILVFPRNVYLSPDDQIHFRNAYFFMEETTELKGGFAALESISFQRLEKQGFDELATIYDSMNEANEIVIDSEYHVAETPHLYSRLVYLPFYLGLKLSSFLNLSFTLGVAVAKIFNLICYVTLIYFAIKQSGKFNKIFFVLGLLTCNFFLVTQFSYDPLVIASLFLAISLFLHIRQSEQVSPKYLLGFILVATLGSLNKAVYCPILLLALMIPNSKFDCKKRAIAFKLCAMFAMLVIASTFVLPILSGGMASDIRGGNTSVSGQIGFLLNNPLKAILVVIGYLVGQLPDFIFNTLDSLMSSAPIFSACSQVISLVGVLNLIIVFWVIFGINLDGTTITNKTKVGLALIYLVLVGAVTASMYLSYTEVGSMSVAGVQPRYLAPFFPLFLIILIPSGRLRDKKTYDYITLFIPYICLALIFSTYVLRLSML